MANARSAIHVCVTLRELAMLKNPRTFIAASAKQTKHQQEMTILREHHARMLKDGALREATLVGSGLFVRSADGKLVVAKPYDQASRSRFCSTLSVECGKPERLRRCGGRNHGVKPGARPRICTYCQNS